MAIPLRLYHYWQSSCSWRVRMAMALKQIPCERVHIELLSGELKSEAFLKRYPMGTIPVLELIGNPSRHIGESLPIVEWLDENFPSPSLFPKDGFLKARARQLSEVINAGTQPLQNIRITTFHSQIPEEQLRWNQQWIHYGLTAYERLVKETAGKFSIGDTLTVADLCLVPQCYNATVRYQMTLDQWPTIQRICGEVEKLKECADTGPEACRP